MLGLSVGDLDGTRVGSLVRGEMVGEPSGRAGQNAGQALAVSACDVKDWIEMEMYETFMATNTNASSDVLSHQDLKRDIPYHFSSSFSCMHSQISI